MEFVATAKGRRKILLNGFGYVLDKTRGAVSYWTCNRRKECDARLSTRNDVLMNAPPAHLHQPNPAKVAAEKTVADIRQRAQTSEEPTGSVIQNSTATFPLAAAGALPKKKTARLVRRKRKAPEGENITEDLQRTTRGEQFLALHDEETGLVILTTDENLQILSIHPHWFADGTFDSAPEGYQLYTIHVIVDQSKTIPVVYCIAKNKDEATYNRILSFLKECQDDLDPLSIMVDFEKAAINAIKRQFPEANVQGCLFHFGQCLWHKIQQFGLQGWYSERPENALLIKMFQALSFVPVDRVVEEFINLLQSLDDESDELLTDFLTYFEATWIGIVQRGRRRRPTFAIELWNVHGRVVDNLPRTNNSTEGWHHAFDLRVGITHPNTKRLIQKLRQEAADHELELEQLRLGIQAPPPKKKYQTKNLRLQNIVANFDDRDILAYLLAIAHNL